MVMSNFIRNNAEIFFCTGLALLHFAVFDMNIEIYFHQDLRIYFHKDLSLLHFAVNTIFILFICDINISYNFGINFTYNYYKKYKCCNGNKMQ